MVTKAKNSTLEATISVVNVGAGMDVLVNEAPSQQSVIAKSIKAGTNVTITDDGSTLTINSTAASGTGGITGATNAGTGAGVASGVSGTSLVLKSLKAGPNISITSTADEITVEATGTASGEANTASNVGTGVGVFKSKTGVNLALKTLKAGANVTLTPSADEILIEASGTGGGTPFADISAYGAVGDFVPAAGSTGTGTINDGAVNSAISSGKPLWIPAGNFLVTSAVQTALNNVTTTGPGTLWISTNVGITKMGKMLVIGTNRSHEVGAVGGIKLGGESGEGIRQWMGHHNWMQCQPTKYGAPAQLQIYSNAIMAQASCVSPNILNAQNGTTFDTTKLDVGDHFGWHGAVYKIVSVTSSQITCTTLAGASPAFVTNATARPFFHAYETATGTVNTSGTSVIFVSGEQFPYGYTGDHMTARINGTLYQVTLGPESLNANSLTLAASAGTQTNVPCTFKRGYGPWAYVSLFRLQGLVGGYETNGGIYLNIKNELVIFNGATHSNLIGNLRVNAPRIRLGNDDGNEQLEVGTNYVALGGSLGSESLRVISVASAVNYIQVSGAATGFAPVVSVRGTDANPDMGFDLQGNGTFRFTAGSFGRTVLEVFAPSGTNTWPTTSAGSGVGSLSVNSSLTNADMAVAPKGITGRLLLKKVPICSLTRTGAMTFNNNTGTTILWDTELTDVHGMHAAGASAVVAPVQGLYRINASYQISATSDANGVIITGVYLLKNGAAVKASPITRHRGPNGTAYICGAQFNGTIELNAGDTVEIQGYYGGASATASLDTSFTFTCFDVELVTAY